MHVKHTFQENTYMKYNRVNSNVTNEAEICLFQLTCYKQQLNCASENVLYVLF